MSTNTDTWILTSLGDLVHEDDFPDYVREDEDYEYHEFPSELDEDDIYELLQQ